MDLPQFLHQDEDGSIRLTGHRVDLLHVVQLYNEGFSVEMLVSQFPTLPLALVHKVIAFYLENQQGVDAYVVASQDEIARQSSQPRVGPDLTELRRRAEAARKAEAK